MCSFYFYFSVLIVKMNLKMILLLQLLVLVATATRESLEDPEDSENETEIAGQEEREEDEEEENEENTLVLPQLDPSDCQFQVIKTCNQKFKSSFARKPGVPARNHMELYCKGIQVSLGYFRFSASHVSRVWYIYGWISLT